MLLSFVGDDRRRARGAVRRLDTAVVRQRLQHRACRSPTTWTRRFSFWLDSRGRWRRPWSAASLAAAGVVFQGLLQNPLASPYTLGVSAGAALGAMIAISFGAALADRRRRRREPGRRARVAVLVVYALATARHRGLSTTVLLLVRASRSTRSSRRSFSSSSTSATSPTRTARCAGSWAISTWRATRPSLRALPFVVASLAAFAWLARPLNLLSLGDEAADEPRARHAARPADRVLQRRRLPRAPPCRSAVRSASSASSCRTSSDSSSAPTTGSCCRRQRSLAPAFLVGCDTVARTRHGAAGTSRRHHHGGHWRAVLLVATLEKAMNWRAKARNWGVRLAALGAWGSAACGLGLCGLGLSASTEQASPTLANHQSHSGGHRDALRDRRRRSRWSAFRASTRIRPRRRRERASARC